jgi:hypothetical protein
MDESPMWAANQGDLHEAARILRHSYGADVEVAPDAPAVRRRRAAGFSPRVIKQLFAPRYRRRTVLAGVVGAMQSMQYYAVGFYLSAITLELYGESRLTGIVAPMIFNFAFGVTGGFLGCALLGRWGSRTLAQRGFLCTAVLLVLAGVIGGSGVEGIAAYAGGLLIGLFIFCHAAGPGAQGMTLATLSYPTSLRGAGAGFAQAVLRVGSTLGLVFFPIMTDALGLKALIVLAAAPLIGFITTLLIRWEPIGADVDAEDFDAGDERPPRPATAGVMA